MTKVVPGLVASTVKDFLQPGDCLLYRSGGVIGWIISTKTWHRVSHCEAYAGEGKAVASRGPQDGTGGVRLYDLRLNDLVHILRPIARFNFPKAYQWFKTVDGQGYDIWALFRFFTIGKGSETKMMCSEFLTRFYRAGGLEPFQPDEDADLVAPCSFLISPHFDHYRVEEDGKVDPVHVMDKGE